MVDEHREPPEVTTARRRSAYLLIAVASLLAVVDSFRADFELNPIVLLLFLVAAAGLLAVKIDWPSIGGGK